MSRRLYLIDSHSLYTTAQVHYRGKVDFSFLMQRLREQNEDGLEMDAVVFHGEPRKGKSDGFQGLLKELGYQVVVIPPRMVPNSSVDGRNVALHLAGYVLPRLGAYTHYDFVSGDIDYSPISSYLVQRGFYVRLWLFSDRLFYYGQDEEVFHSLIPLNESYMLQEGGERKSAFGIGPGDPLSDKVEIKKALRQAKGESTRLSLALELGMDSDTGCEDL